jgi:hypothetical protein
MKFRILIILSIVFYCFGQKTNNDIQMDTIIYFKSKISKLKLDKVDGERVGYGGNPGKFYIIAIELIKNANEKCYLELLKDNNPVVRILGAYCLINKDKKKYNNELLKYISDTSSVDYQPFGCIINK